MSLMNPRSSITLRLYARFGLVSVVSTAFSKRLWPSLFACLLLLLLLFSYTSVAAAQAQGTFRPTGDMTTPRQYGHTATLLLNSKVLITGGAGPPAAGATSANLFASSELFDPVT